jgi:CRP/FNR family transcriptional regulator, cyclic AMP receptor protein
VSPRASATQHELARAALLAELPGETLAQLARRMEREELGPGATIFSEGEEAERFYVLLSGVVSLTQTGLGSRVLRPGDTFGEVSLALRIPRAGTARTITPATVASCDRATFDEFLRPLFADDGVPEPDPAA